MKKIKYIVLAVILWIGLAIAPIEAKESRYGDIKANHWAYAEIEEAFHNGIMKGAGYSKGRIIFKPNDVLTKDQFLAVLTRAFYMPETKETKKETALWYEVAYKIAQKYHLIDSSVLMSQLKTPVTRREMAVIFYRMLLDYQSEVLGDSQVQEYENKIPDWNKLSTEEEKRAVAEMFRKGILKGVDDSGIFAPDKVFSRAEMAVIYSRLNKLLYAEQKIRASRYYEKQVVELVNAERQKRGLSPLTWDPILSEAALTRAAEVLKVYEHIRPDGRPISTVLTDSYDYPYFSLGENIAIGFEDAKSVMEAWMDSPGHRSKILEPNFTHIGVGYYEKGWTQLFTRPL